MTYIVDEEDYLQHYGIKRRSGRYPWGSGKDEQQRARTFLGMVDDYKKQGLSESQIAEAFSDPNDPDHPFTTTMLRAAKSIARAERRAADISMAERLKAKGMSNAAIAERMGLAGESSVRALLNPGAQVRADDLQTLASFMKDDVAAKGFVDVGIGTERYSGSSRTQFDTALAVLKSEGYEVINVQVDQLGTGNKTLVKVLAPPGTTYRDVVTQKDKIQPFGGIKTDKGPIVSDPPPLNISSKRVGIKYAEDGGADADGVIYVRPGVKDVSLDGANYAQVRIAVDGTHYLKGMAVYKADLPDGVDLQFNTNKSNTGNKLDAMKPIKDDPTDPFGAVTKPILNPDGTRKSAMNIVNTEGDWSKWSRNLASQMLSKQQPTLAKELLDQTYENKRKDLDEILALTNPAVKRKLLESYADGVDSASVHLQAAHMPRQATQVILPIPRDKIKETEIYAPQFRDGERVALVRYPHGGTFEIPELTVNNRNPTAAGLIGKAAKDAVGIHPLVAERLSGADFDGDTVLVIPNNAGKVKSKPALQQLKNFDPKQIYAPYDGMTTIDGGTYNAATKTVDYGNRNPSGKRKQNEMGKVSNLITDMTIKGANDAEIARAVKHSMVVIDSEKHRLNFKQSYLDNGIAQLKEKYQGGKDRGATTLISRTSSEKRVPYRKQAFKIDPVTGEKIYNYTGEGYVRRTVTKTGEVREKFIPRITKSTQGAEARDARKLTSAYDSKGIKVGSSTKIEEAYATHANRLKTLANEARKAQVSTKSIPYSPSAKKVYDSEVTSLNAKLNLALRNAPIERQAQIIANAVVKQKLDANPDMTGEEIKKISGKALLDARLRTGAGKPTIDLTDGEWDAIQAGAISNDKLEKILNNADLDRVKELATPRVATVMTSTKQLRAKQLLASGRTPSEVADILGVPLSTLNSSMTREGE